MYPGKQEPVPRALRLCRGAPVCTQRRDPRPVLSKPHRANEEIAQVRAKAKAESAALHAGLRKEQMKVESLERALQQKVTRRGCRASRAGSAADVPLSPPVPPGRHRALLSFQNQEIEELTKICDELIAKLGKTD